MKRTPSQPQRVAVVTGAGAGIGLAITQSLAAAGIHVHAGSRTVTDALGTLSTEGTVTAHAVDLTTPQAPAQLVAAAGTRLDILVNNVGGSVPRPDGFVAVTDEQWHEALTLNLMAAVRTTRAALPIMLAAGSGSIVNIVSVNAWLPDPAIIDYSAAKAALWNFTKSLSKEVAAHGIRVNSIAPGPVATKRWAPDQIAGVASRMATGRMTAPTEIAAMVLTLIDPRSGNVTGATFTVDGGLVPTL